MPIRVVPPLTGHVLSHFVVFLREGEHTDVQIGQQQALLGAHLPDWSYEGQHHARHAQELVRGARSVGEDDGAGVFEAARSQCRVEEEGFGVWVQGQRCGRCVVSSPCLEVSRPLCRRNKKKKCCLLTISRDNDDLRALGDQLPEGLRKRQIPADEHANLPDGGVEHLMGVVARGRQVRPLRVPDVLLAVGAEDLAVVGDEVGRVVEADLLVSGLRCFHDMALDDRPRDDADVKLLGESLVGLQVFLILAGLHRVCGVVGGPADKVISADEQEDSIKKARHR